jgi:outer membrane protein assembly factor BamB
MVFSGVTRAENWPQFRGPTGQGISQEKNLPLAWGQDKNIAWRTPLEGEGWSSPIVWQDHVFVTAATDGGKKCHVIALDRSTGKPLWNKEVFQQTLRRKEGKNSYATPTPCTDGERVYACFGDGSFVALDFKGNIIWTNRDYQHYSRHGLGSSPILYDNLLIMPRDGSSDGADEKVGWQKPWDQAFVVALDVKTGKEVWKAARGSSRIAHVTPIQVKVIDYTELISPAGDVVQSFVPSTGKLLWTTPAQGEGVSPSPVLAGELLVASSGFEATTLRGIRVRGAGEQGEIVWEQKRNVPTQSSPVFVAPHVFTVTDAGVLTCFQAADGKLVWQERLQGNFCASPLVSEGKIYLCSEQGDCYLFEAGDKFNLLAKNSLGERIQASPAASEKMLILRSDRAVYGVK